MAGALASSTTLRQEELNDAAQSAADALEKFRAHLQQLAPSLPNETALGREAYLFFLRKVALNPFTPEELLAMGRQEWARAVAFEVYEKNRNKDVPPLKLASDRERWIADAAAKELEIRKFLGDHAILTVPDWMQHYALRPIPEYLRGLGVTEEDDFTSPSRLNENCIRYVDSPSPKLGYFMRATAQDPRPLTVHEGIPGHYFQLCLSWKHEDPIRRHYYDSGANEGIGFYAEEMMLQAGLFDDSPHTREIIYNFMRLRALRVEVDVRLALGEFTLEQAAKYLEEKVPMDPGTAHQEAIAFSTGPGQAITYQIGKLQIIKMLAEARLQQGEEFNLRAFHDFLWKNGNVPISLQRWEYLGRDDEVPKYVEGPLRPDQGTLRPSGRKGPSHIGSDALFLAETCEEPAEIGEAIQVTQDFRVGMFASHQAPRPDARPGGKPCAPYRARQQAGCFPASPSLCRRAFCPSPDHRSRPSADRPLRPSLGQIHPSDIARDPAARSPVHPSR